MSDLNETPAYVLGRFVDATQHHGDRVLELWDDDVYRTRSDALIAGDEQVDVGDPELPQWRVFELRDVTEAAFDPTRCDCEDCAADEQARRAATDGEESA